MKRSRIMIMAFVVALLLVAALLAACSGRLPSLPGGPATKAPTAMPPSGKQVVAPTQPVSSTQAITPTKAPAAAAATPVTPTIGMVITGTISPAVTVTLEGTSWKMVSYLDSKGQTTQVLTNTEVTVQFQDGKVSGKDGCNQYAGAYKLAASVLTVKLSASTMIACDPKITAQAQAYAAALGSATTYKIAGKQLQITNGAGKVAVTYAVAEGVAAAPVAPAAPITPTTKAPAPAATITSTVKPAATVAPTAAPTKAGTSLTDATWKWVRFVSPSEVSDVADSDKYALVFGPGGTINVVADCNKASGIYKTVGSRMQIQLTPAILAACPSGSLSDQFIKNLGEATLYFTDDGSLYIELFADSGVMKFASAGPAK